MKSSISCRIKEIAEQIGLFYSELSGGPMSLSSAAERMRLTEIFLEGLMRNVADSPLNSRED
jgi:hypothetical protein